jgi:pimeloyl-ACP methyl ester carboxylesterase
MQRLAACPTTCPRVAPAAGGEAFEHRFVEAGGLRFHLVEGGQGPLVLLLHGFPEFWYAWRRQLPVLAERFRVVALDLPGYNLSEPSPDGYGAQRLVAHLAALVPALGAERAHLVAHDWGGVLGWGLAMWAPERVAKLAILNAPHPGTYLRELRHNPRQMLRSWYVGFFQLPRLPEWWLGRNRCRAVAELLRRTAVQSAAFEAADLEAYRLACSRPGALSAALGYYRALGRQGPRGLARSLRPIEAETLVIWGEQDVALVPELLTGLERWVPRLRLVRVPDSGHWVQLERPDLVNAALLDFL